MVRIPIWDRLQSRRPPFRVNSTLFQFECELQNRKQGTGDPGNSEITLVFMPPIQPELHRSWAIRWDAMGNPHMTDDFEDHCWQDIVTAGHSRDLFALPAQDLRRTGAGAARPSIFTSWSISGGAEAGRRSCAKTYPSACGEYAYDGDRADQAAVRRGARGRACRSSIRPAIRAPKAGPTSSPRPSGEARRSIRPSLRHPAGIQAAAGRRRHHQAARQRLLRHAAHRASHPARHPDPDHLRREHLGLRARLARSMPIRTASTSCWSRNAASTAARCRTRSISSTCITNMPT